MATTYTPIWKNNIFPKLNIGLFEILYFYKICFIYLTCGKVEFFKMNIIYTFQEQM